MKKTATKISGILTLIFSICLFTFSLLIICARFNIGNVSNIINNLTFLQIPLTYFSYIYVSLPAGLVALILTSVEFSTIEIVFISLFFTFSILMVFWGIKEILISNRDDVDFANCKRTCGFMFFTKFMFFAYTVFIIIASFVINEVKSMQKIISL